MTYLARPVRVLIALSLTPYPLSPFISYQSKILLLFRKAAFRCLLPVYLIDRMSLLLSLIGPLFQLQLKLESTSLAKFSSHRSVSGASSGFR